MICVTVDLLSSKGSSNDLRLGAMTITNDGLGSATIGHYDVKMITYSKGSKRPVRTRRVKIHNFPRQSRNVWRLILRALEELLEERSRK